MTLKEKAAVLGMVGKWSAGNGLVFSVEVLDAREVYGRTDYLVKPVAGTDDAAWVSSGSVSGLKKEG